MALLTGRPVARAPQGLPPVYGGPVGGVGTSVGLDGTVTPPMASQPGIDPSRLWDGGVNSWAINAPPIFRQGDVRSQDIARYNPGQGGEGTGTYDTTRELTTNYANSGTANNYMFGIPGGRGPTYDPQGNLTGFDFAIKSGSGHGLSNRYELRDGYFVPTGSNGFVGGMDTNQANRATNVALLTTALGGAAGIYGVGGAGAAGGGGAASAGGVTAADLAAADMAAGLIPAGQTSAGMTGYGAAAGGAGGAAGGTSGGVGAAEGMGTGAAPGEATGSFTGSANGGGGGLFGNISPSDAIQLGGLLAGAGGGNDTRGAPVQRGAPIYADPNQGQQGPYAPAPNLPPPSYGSANRPASQVWQQYAQNLFQPTYQPPSIPGIFGMQRGGYGGFYAPQMRPVGMPPGAGQGGLLQPPPQSEWPIPVGGGS